MNSPILTRTLPATIFAAIIGSGIALGGCAKKEGPTCEQVASHVINMLNEELTKDGDPTQLKTARAIRPTVQNGLLMACQEESWGTAAKQCILDAKTVEETTACDPRTYPEGSSAKN